jgi:chloramphenicol 3-O phosphotransferase
MPGRIIILNGTSSSGKSSVAKELKNLIPDGHHMRLDDFILGAPEGFRTVSGDFDSNQVGFFLKFSEDRKRITDYMITPKGYAMMERVHAAVSAFSKEGSTIIYETVISDDQMLRSAAAHFGHHEVFFIAVRCSEEERRKRELNRGDRQFGLYKLKAHFIYELCQYDFEVDNTFGTPLESAVYVAKMLEEVRPKVFQNLIKEIA